MKTWLLIFIFIPFISFSQYIKSNQTDAFTHQKRIVTSDINLTAVLSFKGKHTVSNISYHTIDNKIYIVLYGSSYNYAGSVLQDDIALLVTEKDTIVIKSAGLQNAYGKYIPDNFDTEYLIAKEDVIKLSQSKLLSVRIYSTVGIFEDFIKEKFQSNLMLLSDALLKEMDK